MYSFEVFYVIVPNKNNNFIYYCVYEKREREINDNAIYKFELIFPWLVEPLLDVVIELLLTIERPSAVVTVVVEDEYVLALAPEPEI
jgi:hypothetical protein